MGAAEPARGERERRLKRFKHRAITWVSYLPQSVIGAAHKVWEGDPNEFGFGFWLDASYLKWCRADLMRGVDEHRPRRGDDVEEWLKRRRDAWNRTGERPEFHALDSLLDRYRECADYGLTLRPEDDEQGDPW